MFVFCFLNCLLYITQQPPESLSDGSAFDSSRQQGMKRHFVLADSSHSSVRSQHVAGLHKSVDLVTDILFCLWDEKRTVDMSLLANHLTGKRQNNPNTGRYFQDILVKLQICQNALTLWLVYICLFATCTLFSFFLFFFFHYACSIHYLRGSTSIRTSSSSGTLSSGMSSKAPTDTATGDLRS